MRSSNPCHCVFFCSSARGPHGHNDKELSSSLSCFFVLVLQVSHVHDDKKLGSSSSCMFLFKCWRSSCSFVIMLQVNQVHDDKELDSSLSCFFCSNVVNPKGTIRRSSAPHYRVIFLFKCCKSPRPRWQEPRLLVTVYFFSHSSTWRWKVQLLAVVYFFCSSVGSPHGHNNEELSSSLSCSFVLVWQVSQAHNDKEFNSALSCFFCSSVVSPRDTTTMNSIPLHHVIFLFKYCRSLGPRQKVAELLIILLFFYFGHLNTWCCRVFFCFGH
jgi:hypothetical protein